MTFENDRYSAEYVGRVRDAAARAFLVTVGLPAGHVLFSAAESTHEGGVVRVSDRDVLKIGFGAESGEEDAYCVDCGTGAVVFVDLDTRAEFHVNASPRQFADCLTVFDREVSTATGSGEADPEQLAEVLEAAIGEADPTALADDLGFWRSILDDVAVGDYTDDE